MQAKGFADDPLDPVAAHCATCFGLDTNTETAARLAAAEADQGETSPAQPRTVPINQIIFSGFPEQTGFRESELLHAAQAESLLRPLARRLLITSWPDRVLIRARNPWVRARLILLG